MTIRPASAADLDTIRVLWEEFAAEIGGPHFTRETWEEERVDVVRRMNDGFVLLAEEDGQALGYAELDVRRPAIAWLSTIYVRPAARLQGVARAMLRSIVAASRERGYRDIGLHVLTSNGPAHAMYAQLGFAEYQRAMWTSLEELDARLAREPLEPSLGRVYVQTDDAEPIERALQQFIPRLGRSERTDVSEPRDGWIEVDDELCSADPKALRRLAQEISYRTGGVVLALGIEEGVVVRYILFDRGSVADEYASLPEHYGPLPPGDVIGLGANPTVAERLTGADPERLRAVARTARSPDDLPPPQELYAQLAAVLGVG